MLCDFCRMPATWSYPAGDVTVMDLPVRQVSVGAWAACDECSQLIEAGEHESLARRSLATFPRGEGISDLELLETLRGIHLSFWSARSGPRRPL